MFDVFPSRNDPFDDHFNKWCAVSNFLFKNIDFCIFTPKTLLVKENYFLTLWNFTYLKDTSFCAKNRAILNMA